MSTECTRKVSIVINSVTLEISISKLHRSSTSGGDELVRQLVESIAMPKVAVMVLTIETTMPSTLSLGARS